MMRHQGFDYELLINPMRLLDDEAWPWPVGGPVRVVLRINGKELVLLPGADESLRPAGLTEGFRFSQNLSSQSQPFELRAQRWTGPAEWPWPSLLLAASACGLLVTLLSRIQAQRDERRRAAELQRLSQVARLNTLGELAAGMAHELNQPLTAVLSGTQAALRLLNDAREEGSIGDAADAVPALELAAAQARRAAEVVSRLRGLVQPPALGPASELVDLPALVRSLFRVLGPQLQEHQIRVELTGISASVRADRIALEQILHNLLVNAMQALEHTRKSGGQIEVSVSESDGWVECRVSDNGDGISREHQARVFEPFFTTRADGLGLGLSLCQTLAQAMGGQLSIDESPTRGACFCLRLPRPTSPSLSP